MKFFKVFIVVGFCALFSSAYVMAGTCEIKYERTACPGKEKISYKKCKGKKTCSKFKEAASVEECQALATKSCSNKRLSITKSKVINAVYDGNAIKSKTGKSDFCLDYENKDKEFNKCG